MENEKRLIDANALSDKIGIMKFEITRNRGGYRYCNEEEKNEWDKLDSFDSLVCDAPTVDAAKVVRCEDCKHWERWETTCGIADKGYCKCHEVDAMEDDDFCSYGERRGKDGESY